MRGPPPPLCSPLRSAPRCSTTPHSPSLSLAELFDAPLAQPTPQPSHLRRWGDKREDSRGSAARRANYTNPRVEFVFVLCLYARREEEPGLIGSTVTVEELSVVMFECRSLARAAPPPSPALPFSRLPPPLSALGAFSPGSGVLRP